MKEERQEGQMEGKKGDSDTSSISLFNVSHTE